MAFIDETQARVEAPPALEEAVARLEAEYTRQEHADVDVDDAASDGGSHVSTPRTTF